jgi:aspartate aminotransferase-like enzyme
MQGAFSDRYSVAESNGKEAVPLKVEWGKAITAKAIDAELLGAGTTRSPSSTTKPPPAS